MPGLSCGNDGLEYAKNKVKAFEEWYVKNAVYKSDADKATAQQLLTNKDYMLAVESFGLVWWLSYVFYNCKNKGISALIHVISEKDVKAYDKLFTTEKDMKTWNDKWENSPQYKEFLAYVIQQYALRIGWDIASYVALQIVIAMLPGIVSWIQKQTWIPKFIRDFLISGVKNAGNNLSQIVDNIKAQLKSMLLQLAGQNTLLKSLLSGAFDSVSNAIDAMANALGNQLSKSLTGTLTGIVSSITAMIKQSQKQAEVTSNIQGRLLTNLTRQSETSQAIATAKYDALHTDVLKLGTEWL